MIKLTSLIKESSIRLGKIYTDKDLPPFKTNPEIERACKEANLNEAPDNDMFKALNKVNNNIFKIMLKYEGKADINAVFSSWMLGLHAKLKKAGVTL